MPGTIVILNDVIGTIQSVDGDKYEILCDDGKIRRFESKVKPVEVVNPHALALLYYTKLLERIKNGTK